MYAHVLPSTPRSAVAYAVVPHAVSATVFVDDCRAALFSATFVPSAVSSWSSENESRGCVSACVTRT